MAGWEVHDSFLSSEERKLLSRWGHSAVTFQKKRLIVFGGISECDLFLNDVVEINLPLSEEKKIRCSKLGTYGDVPEPRAFHSATLVGNFLYVFGGKSGVSVFGDLYRLDLVNLNWTKIPFKGPYTPNPRYGHSASLWRDSLYIFGGHLHPKGRFMWPGRAVSEKDCAGIRIELQKADLPPSKRRKLNRPQDSEESDSSGASSSESESNDQDRELSATCSQMGVGPYRRAAVEYDGIGHSATVFGDRLFLLGGCNLSANNGSLVVRDSNVAVVDLEEISLTTRHEEYTRPLTELPPRAFHAAVRVEDRLLVLGGWDSRTDRAVAGLFESTVTQDGLSGWTEHNFTCGGRPVAGHTANLVGDRLVVIGGNVSWQAPTEAESQAARPVCASMPLACIGLFPLVREPESDNLITGPLLGNDEFADMRVKTHEGLDIPAHKAIVLQRCPHFKNILASNMAEARVQTIYLPESDEVVRAFLKYLYGGPLATDLLLVCELLRLADMYFANELRSLCIKFLTRHVSVDTVTSIFHAATMARADELILYCLEFVSNHLKQWCLSDDTFDPTLLRTLMLKCPDHVRLIS